MQDHNKQNIWRPLPKDDDDEEFHGIKPSRYARRITAAAVFCSLFPMINAFLIFAYGGFISQDGSGFVDQYAPLFFGTLLHALFSIPSAIGIGLFKSKVMLIYGIVITAFFCFISSYTLCAVTSGRSIDLDFIFFAICRSIDLAAILVYFLAREPFEDRKYL